MKTSIIIPARYGSTRYAGKPLVKIFGRELVLRVADICKKVDGNKNLYIATDDKKIAKVAEHNGYKYIMTSKSCLTGTDRVAEASQKIKSKIIVNVQGDEPLIKPGDIKKIIKNKILYPNHVICGYDRIHYSENPENPNLPKVVLNNKNELIYISRSKIPGSKKNQIQGKYYKQVCIYAFNKSQLKKYLSLNKKSDVEKQEDIEILRFFDLNIKIKMVKLNSNSVAVDEIKDKKKVEQLLLKKKK